MDVASRFNLQKPCHKEVSFLIRTSISGIQQRDCEKESWAWEEEAIISGFLLGNKYELSLAVSCLALGPKRGAWAWFSGNRERRICLLSMSLTELPGLEAFCAREN